jgi:hypothetical protein
MKNEKKNKHEKSESKSYEKKEKKTMSEPEYQNGMMKKNYKGKMC